MSGYKRFVSYMYAYPNGKKEQNTGFARIEARGGSCRIFIRLQKIPQEEHSLDIYAFVRDRETLAGIFLGKIKADQGMAQGAVTTKEEEIGESTWDLARISGLWVRGESGVDYITVWDDLPVDTEKLQKSAVGPEYAARTRAGGDAEVSEAPGDGLSAMPKSGAGETPPVSQTGETPPAPAAEAGASELPEPSAVSDEDPTVRFDDGGMSERREERGAGWGESLLPFLTGAEGSPQKQEENERVSALPGAEENEGGPVLSGEKMGERGSGSDRLERPKTACPLPPSFCPRRSGCPSGLNHRWNCIARNYAHRNPFPGTDVQDCVQIAPRDLSVLRQCWWNLSRNNFLLHGFYNYSHLLLIRRRDGSTLLGVPGVYEIQEGNMAAMFGFSMFLEAASPGQKQRFGYWCRSVD